ncbi:TraB/GumN family protein [Lysobacter xinjiangensis]|uniref:TraB/GumN family protein n=1 Tax=Cognatilysobacter xinjiangensis TaxID=546892 RepID=A0ABQ3BVK3_9GAMM|nr:TraB/GumN family protein [Lysobacter xinjiangensis]GGZ58879.1 TraB/GumN family protein [Lysobacter xinjiangensis]
MRRFALAIAGLLLALPVSGSTPTPVRTDAPPVPLLWKVSDADNSVYLLGSFHLLRKSDYPLSADIDRAFDDAEALVFEIAPEELDDPGIAARMLQLATSNPASTIGQVLPTELREPLQRQARRLGVAPEQLDQFEPWFVDTTLVTLMAQRNGFAPEDGLDRHLMARARAAGKSASGLETVAQQLATLDGMPMDEQIDTLREFVEEGEGATARLEELHGAWRRADVPLLEQLTREDMADRTPVTYQRLNVDRNRAWIPRFEAMLAKPAGNDVLAVVGALHLLGDDGVVAMLKARGYRVDRVCTACDSRTTR